MPGDRFTPDFDPDYGDARLTTARKDIANGRWQGLRDLLRVTGPAWSVRGHRIRLLAPACAGNSLVESWLAAEPRSADALVLRAATEVARAFTLAAAGGHVPVEQRRVDQAVMACLQGAEACPEDPTPWICLISVARLYTPGVRRQELGRWWDELHARDPYTMEGHLHVLRYYSARWHGNHGLMYDFARDAAAVAPPGCALPVLVQFARVEEYRSLQDGANGRGTRPAISTGTGTTTEPSTTYGAPGSAGSPRARTASPHRRRCVTSTTWRTPPATRACPTSRPRSSGSSGCAPAGCPGRAPATRRRSS